MGTHPNHIDVPFSVPFVHRVRFTRDVLGKDRDELIRVMEPSGGEPARAQFWVDEGVSRARPDLGQRVHAIVQEQAGRVRMAGNMQVVPGGEAIKNDIHILERMLKVMHAAGLDRKSYIVVIGGGAVLDAVGFAAAIAHRGIRLVRLPSTTLSQADSGVGVKNGVNLFGKKNWIGTFAAPWSVINDETLLETLSDRNFICGMSEAVKVALLKDASLFERIEATADAIRRRDMAAALGVVHRSAMLHLRHITDGGDPFETRESRPLDFGHWSAHKLEAMSGFTLPHGEAVAIGVAIDAVYSSLAHGFPADDAERVIRCLSRLGFSLDGEQPLRTEELLAGLEEFRQHIGGQMTLTLLEGIGKPIDTHEIDPEKLDQAIRTVMERRVRPSVG